MKKITTKIAFLSLVSVLMVGTMTTSCSNDDKPGEEQTKGTIDAAVGTYKGKLRSVDLDQYEHFDAIIMVTKVDNQHLKVEAKSGETYSAVTAKIFKVVNSDNGDVNNAFGILEGHFWYTADVKNLEMGTERQSATDINYIFEGVKQ